ncbi:PP2C family protein-serine/threonine phosphatase [Nocardioides panaciterrulae]|uniref:Serine phosphatase RsbU (Regulator of sigma subunit) n=1 Tax=Nocardioides panaciterrulae TaxID=661492 RepID=A0A7Y9E963_9ACTN|nr:GAF domain-containing SpoIIE family protein phosphatase [Nocardioides panaciterrulae]NYD43220.1 serine phosphatase RsbU (regulator of sigma subunit) [Nocardioides panaciterrulae]
MPEERPGPDDLALDSRAEGFGERLLGSLLDRAHTMPPQLIAPLIAQEVARIGGRDVTVLLQDYDQMTLVALPGEKLVVGGDQPIDDSLAGLAFQTDEIVERPWGDVVRLYVPLLDGTDRIGVLVFTLDRVDEHHRRLVRRLAGLVADMIVTKNMYTDRFFQARRRKPMSLSAEMQWQLLPPLMMTTPQVAVAGALEPAYDVAGDSFDYALNDDTLHLCMIDAMGHGLSAAVMSTVAIGAYRHARRADVELSELYAAMDSAVADQFGPERFATAQMAALDVMSGRLRWVNAGHPPPLLLRAGRIVAELDSPTTLPVGFGGDTPIVTERMLLRGDRVLFYTDGLVEERLQGGIEFGDTRMREVLERVEVHGVKLQESVRRMSRLLMVERGGATTDDSTLLMVEWAGAPAHELATPADPPELPPG